jgi:hypothetical protein
MQRTNLSPIIIAVSMIAYALCCAPMIGYAADEPTPAPAPGVAFALPLSDGSQTTAKILPGPDAKHWLVYATKSGQLVVWTVAPTDPGPIPPPPPPPPIDTRLKIAIVEQPTASTPQQRGIMADKAWRTAIPPPHLFIGVLPLNIINPDTGKPPEQIAPFLRAAEGRPLPLVVLLDEFNTVYSVVPLPDSAAGILSLIPKPKARAHAPTDH